MVSRSGDEGRLVDRNAAPGELVEQRRGCHRPHGGQRQRAVAAPPARSAGRSMGGKPVAYCRFDPGVGPRVREPLAIGDGLGGPRREHRAIHRPLDSLGSSRTGGLGGLFGLLRRRGLIDAAPLVLLSAATWARLIASDLALSCHGSGRESGSHRHETRARLEHRRRRSGTRPSARGGDALGPW